MKYISICSGIGGFEKGIQEAIPSAQCVGYSEIDKHAIFTYQAYYDHPPLGDVTKADFTPFNGIADLLVGGTPCQSLSIQTANRTHLEGKSKLFFEFVRALKEIKPKHFILENVASMSAESRQTMIDVLAKETGQQVHCTLISSDHFTPQKRNRLYFTNFPVEPPKCTGPRWSQLLAWSKSTRYPEGSPSYVEERTTTDGRANTLVTGIGCRGQSTCNYIMDGDFKRPLSPEECEQLQGFPVGWTALVPPRERFRQIGNAVTPQVIEHIARQIPDL